MCVFFFCFLSGFLFFFNQNTAYVFLISDWSSDVCSSDLDFFAHFLVRVERLTTSDDNFTIIGCREGPRQPRSVERFQPPDPAGIEAVEVGSGLRRQRQAR